MLRLLSLESLKHYLGPSFNNVLHNYGCVWAINPYYVIFITLIWHATSVLCVHKDDAIINARGGVMQWHIL